MAGQLTISTLSDGTNSTSSTNCIQGSAKAWVNFNGTTSPGTIRASYNISSVTKNGTGDYTLNFTNALPNANYSIIGMGISNNGLNYVWPFIYANSSQVPATYTTSACRMQTIQGSGSTFDCAYTNMAVFD